MKELEKEYLTVKEAGKYLSLSEATIRRHLKTGFLTSSKVGRRVLIPLKKIKEVIKKGEGK